MSFFLILPIWALCVLGGLLLLCLPNYRAIGAYIVVVSTTATIGSFALSTAVLYFGVRAAEHQSRAWVAIALVVAYVGAIAIGGLVGAVLGILATRKFLARTSRTNPPF